MRNKLAKRSKSVGFFKQLYKLCTYIHVYIYSPPALGPVSMETIQETGEILIFADINGGVAQLVSNG